MPAFAVRWKAGVRWDRPTPAGSRIISAIDRATGVMQSDITISCGSEGHPTDDPHTRGEAFDVSVAAFSPAQIVQLKLYLEQVLGRLFTVLYEVPFRPADPTLVPIAYINGAATGPHLHVQLLKGTVWPPAATVAAGVLATG